MKLGLYPTICKNQLRPEVVSIRAENTEKKLLTLVKAIMFFVMTSKAKVTQAKQTNEIILESVSCSKPRKQSSKCEETTYG